MTELRKLKIKNQIVNSSLDFARKYARCEIKEIKAIYEKFSDDIDIILKKIWNYLLIEFNGYATSETGYHSHYFGDFREGAKEPTLKQVRNLISELMEAFYTPPQPLSLFK